MFPSLFLDRHLFLHFSFPLRDPVALNPFRLRLDLLNHFNWPSDPFRTPPSRTLRIASSSWTISPFRPLDFANFLPATLQDTGQSHSARIFLLVQSAHPSSKSIRETCELLCQPSLGLQVHARTGTLCLTAAVPQFYASAIVQTERCKDSPSQVVVDMLVD